MFVHRVEPKSVPDEAGLRVGDQVRTEGEGGGRRGREGRREGGGRGWRRGRENDFMYSCLYEDTRD